MSLKITDWAVEDRPREKLIQKGTSSLSDAELLAILISSGTKDKSAVDLGRELLGIVNNNLNSLGKAYYRRSQEDSWYRNSKGSYNCCCPGTGAKTKTG